MITYKSKTFPNAQSLTVYESKIDDVQMNNELMELIDKRGDEQNHSTNVKAQMTSYHMQDIGPFKKLRNYMKEMVEQISLNENGSHADVVFKSLWGAKYVSGEIAIEHDHWPASYSLVYYIDVPHQCPAGLVFSEANIMKKVYTGLLLCFNGTVRHHVPKVEYRGNRYVAAGNAFIRSYERA